MNIKTITAAELKTLPLNDLVAICKSLDNSNGDWSDVTADEYSDILQTATNLINEYQH
jgi:DNA-binding Xre family transcriptional regulator